jgi:hypothetical protein
MVYEEQHSVGDNDARCKMQARQAGSSSSRGTAAIRVCRTRVAVLRKHARWHDSKVESQDDATLRVALPDWTTHTSAHPPCACRLALPDLFGSFPFRPQGSQAALQTVAVTLSCGSPPCIEAEICLQSDDGQVVILADGPVTARCRYHSFDHAGSHAADRQSVLGLVQVLVPVLGGWDS